MASNAGHGNSAFVGEDKEGKATKNPIPPVRTLPPGGYPVPYELEDTISPPAKFQGPFSVHSALDRSDHEEYAGNRYVRKLLHGASKKLSEHVQFFGNKPPSNLEKTFKMASPQLIFVDGSFAELAQEMADYVQVGEQVKPLLEKEQNEEALQAIVKASHYLNSVPEKEFTGAYNLLVHLVLQSKDPKKYLPTVCGNLLKPITSSPTHGFTLAANALSTVFNLLDKANPLRYNVFMQIIRFVRQHGQFDLLKPRLQNLESWFETWDTDEEDQRRMYIDVAEAAAESGDDEEAYHYLIKGLATLDRDDQEEITSEEAQKLSLRAVRMAISSPIRFDFQDLRALPSVQALSDSHPIYSQLLDIFTEQDLEDYNDFRDEHEGWIEKEKLDHEKLQRKMRLLTFASLAASTPNREIPYANIAKALQIPAEQVEMWTIDVVRAKLVEGRLSQQQKVFLVHRTTYRVFGEKQWRELGTRIDQFKSVVDRLTAMVRKAQADVDAQREREQQELERKLANGRA
ncbi:Eukaryotic translation initiation factor 3 subunit M [Madurella mycetomatis]|uniref:Eukaryotic translation initiation factor 3 subunit M n=1 Tax=Madurella mycetomatis TaxID=100816 RepID=A0A175W2W9_9PEZI|nr:Eukaryotic translation initiation factor 3 subunit M [Madurella mycetomatis]